MSDKYLVVGATGSIGSNLAEQLNASGKEIHLVGRNEDNTKTLAQKLNCSYTVADVLQDSFVDKIKSDIQDIKGIAYCVGSIDLKPLRMVDENDFNKCMKLNLYSAVEVIKGYQESLKKNKGSVVLFSTVAAQLESPEECLDFLSQISQIKKPDIKISWPQGEIKKVKGSATLGNFTIKLTQKGHWFQLQQ